MLDTLRSTDPDLLLLSAGDFYSGRGILELYRSRFLSELMRDMGYDAVGVGELELRHGLRALREDADAGLPVICSNLFEGGERVFPAWKIEEAGGGRIGITAVLGVDPEEGDFEIVDPVAEGMNAVESLRDAGCDAVILLAHARSTDMAVLMPLFDSVDLVIRGHAEKDSEVSSDCADTTGGSFEDLGVPVLFAGDKGRALGYAVLTPLESGRYGLTDTSLVMLGREVERDTAVAARLREFSLEEARRVRQMRIREFVARDPVSGKIRDRYLGIETCRRCHGEVYSDFLLSPHFRAYQRLVESGEQDNPECLRCHTTGYGVFSGFDPASEEKGAVNLRGVQCEACHGPGTGHVRDGTYSERARQSCRACHDPKQSPHFHFQTFWEKVGHRALADTAGAEEAHE